VKNIAEIRENFFCHNSSKIRWLFTHLTFDDNDCEVNHNDLLSLFLIHRKVKVFNLTNFK